MTVDSISSSTTTISFDFLPCLASSLSLAGENLNSMSPQQLVSPHVIRFTYRSIPTKYCLGLYYALIHNSECYQLHKSYNLWVNRGEIMIASVHYSVFTTHHNLSNKLKMISEDLILFEKKYSAWQQLHKSTTIWRWNEDRLTSLGWIWPPYTFGSSRMQTHTMNIDHGKCTVKEEVVDDGLRMNWTTKNLRFPSKDCSAAEDVADSLQARCSSSFMSTLAFRFTFSTRNKNIFASNKW